MAWTQWKKESWLTFSESALSLLYTMLSLYGPTTVVVNNIRHCARDSVEMIGGDRGMQYFDLLLRNPITSLWKTS